jgi:hypothetical protein
MDDPPVSPGWSGLTSLTLICRRRPMRRSAQPWWRCCVKMLHPSNPTIAALISAIKNDVEHDHFSTPFAGHRAARPPVVVWSRLAMGLACDTTRLEPPKDSLIRVACSVPLIRGGLRENDHNSGCGVPSKERLSSRFGGESSVRELDLDAGTAEVDHRDQRVGGVESVRAV